MRNALLPADILLPQNVDMSKWAVVSCDQFTSEPKYWQALADYVGGEKSTLDLIFPEVYLGDNDEARIAKINATMEDYLFDGVFKTDFRNHARHSSSGNRDDIADSQRRMCRFGSGGEC